MNINVNDITITPEILNLISQIDEFKGTWKYISQLPPDRLTSLKKVATIESIGSSTRIEGSSLSDKEVELLLSNIELQSLESRDEQEVVGYAKACEKIYENFNSIPISENSIKQIHVWLLQFSDKDDRHRGEYKKIPIRIDAHDFLGNHVGTVLETTSPLETPIRMGELVTWTKDSLEGNKIHPLIVIGIFVVVLLAIHPFQDGNGRLSRLLTTLLMLKFGYGYVPYSSLESIIEASKESYYLALQQTQKSWQNHHANWNPWLLFFFQCLQRQVIHLQTKIAKEKFILKDLSGLSTQILNLLKEHGRLTIKEIQAITNANRNTLKKTLSSLVKQNHIVINGQGKASWYTLQ